MRQQIDEADRMRGCRRREGHRAAAAGIDAQIGEFRQHAPDRIIERHHALLDQLHEGDRGYRLGHAGDAEKRIRAHRGAVRAQRARLAKMHRLPVASDKHLHAGQLAGLDVLLG